jgi:hypothetical protein
MAHFKLVPKDNESAQSLTSRKPGNDTYGAPERPNVTRAYDIFSVGAIGCDVLVWIKHGPKAVATFKEDRRLKAVIDGFVENVCNFYHPDPKQKKLNPAVIKLLEETIKEGGLLGTVAGILKEMLSYDKADRPKAWEAEKKFAAALGHNTFNVPPPVIVTNKEMLQVPGGKPQPRSLCKFIPCFATYATHKLTGKARTHSVSNQSFPSVILDQPSASIPKVHIEDTQEPISDGFAPMEPDDGDSTDESGYETSEKGSVILETPLQFPQPETSRFAPHILELTFMNRSNFSFHDP